MDDLGHVVPPVRGLGAPPVLLQYPSVELRQCVRHDNVEQGVKQQHVAAGGQCGHQLGEVLHVQLLRLHFIPHHQVLQTITHRSAHAVRGEAEENQVQAEVKLLLVRVRDGLQHADGKNAAKAFSEKAAQFREGKDGVQLSDSMNVRAAAGSAYHLRYTLSLSLHAVQHILGVARILHPRHRLEVEMYY